MLSLLLKTGTKVRFGLAPPQAIPFKKVFGLSGGALYEGLLKYFDG
jgi:hypothetical protein